MEESIVAYNEPQLPNIFLHLLPLPIFFICIFIHLHLKQKPRKLQNFIAIFQKSQQSKNYYYVKSV